VKFYTSAIQWGNNILYRGIDNGRQVTMKETFRPSLFTSSKQPNTKWKSLYGQPLDEIVFDDIRDAKDFMKQYKDVAGFEVHGMEQFQYQYIAKNFPGNIEYDTSQLKVWAIDIETTVADGFPDIQSASEELLLISIMDRTTRKIVVFGTRPHTSQGKYDYIYCGSETKMLKEFIQFWQSSYPDIVTGWNTDTFDFPYLVNRITRVLDDDWVRKLSPFGLINERMVETRNGEVQTYDILGINQLDYLQLYKKFTYTTQESYSLGFIATAELGDTKVESPYDSFKDFYTLGWDLFVEYNAKDSELVMRLDDNLKLIDLVISMAYMAKCNFKDVFGPVRTWDVFIYNHLLEKNIAPPQQSQKLSGHLEGAWVKDPVIGMHSWVMSYDFAALYPNIIRQWNLSPETLLPERLSVSVKDIVNETIPQPDGDYTVAANGTMYRKDVQGIMPELMGIVLDGRKIAKKEMLKLEQQYQDTHDAKLLPKIAALHNRQMALKIMANSGYGALAQVGFRYFDIRIAEAITLTGQASDQHLEKTFNVLMNKICKTEDKDYVIYGDTDSLYLNVAPVVGDRPDPVEFLDRFGEQVLQKAVDRSIDTVFKVCNCYAKTMASKREAIGSKALWCGKKKYAMVVHNSEGVSYNPPKHKVMGLEIVRSSTPKLVRTKLKEGLRLIFDTDEDAVRKFVSDTSKEMKKWTPEEIAFPRGVNDMEKYTLASKSLPIAVRAALLFNHHTDSKKHERIRSKDKIKFLYLKMPNPVRQDVFGFPTNEKLPAEVALDKYVDYDKMIDKTFIAPLKILTDAAGWSLTEKSSLEDFF
jgi:DNA polymerase elongation subunit (family B)